MAWMSGKYHRNVRNKSEAFETIQIIITASNNNFGIEIYRARKYVTRNLFSGNNFPVAIQDKYASLYVCT